MFDLREVTAVLGAGDVDDAALGRLLVAATDALVARDLEGVGDEALGGQVTLLHQQVQRLDGERLRRMREFDRRKAWEREGAGSAKDWAARACGLTRGEAAGDLETARQLENLPKSARKLADGELSMRNARTLARASKRLGGAGGAQLDDLGAAAAGADAREFAEKVDKAANEIDSEALRRREIEAHQRRRLSHRKLDDGSVAGDFRLDPVAGEAFLTAINAASAPRGEPDERTTEQRKADALGELAMRALDEGALPECGGERAHIGVLVPKGALADEEGAAPAQMDFVGAVCNETARMLSCDSSVRRVVMNGRCEPMDIGRASRTRPPVNGAPSSPTIATVVDAGRRQAGPSSTTSSTGPRAA